MSKEHGNMGRKSHLAQDAQADQNLSELQDQLPDNQPTRPYVHPRQADKSSKPGEHKTK